MNTFLPDDNPPFQVDPRKVLLGVSAVCFASAVGIPIYLYFRAGQLTGSRVGAAFVAAVAVLALAWTAVFLLREWDRLWPGSDWAGTTLMNIGGAFGGILILAGTWTMTAGHWGGIVLVLLGSGGVALGLMVLRRYHTKQGRVSVGEAAASRRPGSTKNTKRPPWITVIVWVARRPIVYLVGLLTFIVTIVVVRRVLGLDGAASWAAVLGVFDVFLAAVLLPRFWRWRGFSDDPAVRLSRVKRFEWCWFDRGFTACVVAILAALVAVKWLRGSTLWAIELAAFVAAAIFLALVYEVLRRLLWAPPLSQTYTQTAYCSYCGKEAARVDIRCSACRSMFRTYLG